MRSSTVPDVALARDVRRAEVDATGGLERLAVLERERRRAQHHVDQVPAGLRVREHVAEQQALGDLVASLSFCRCSRSRVDRRAGRRQPGDALGRGVDEVVGAQAVGPVRRELAVQRARMARQEPVPRGVQRGEDLACLGLLARVALRLGRKAREVGGAALEIRARGRRRRARSRQRARVLQSPWATSSRSRSPGAIRVRTINSAMMIALSNSTASSVSSTVSWIRAA